MKAYKIKRVSSTEQGTFGVLISPDGLPICLTCEDPWNENQKMISCIPAGSYQVEKFSGKKYKNVWELKNVPDRSAILIHQGNTIKDTNGCILVGDRFGKLGGVQAIINSSATLNVLRSILPDSFNILIEN